MLSIWSWLFPSVLNKMGWNRKNAAKFAEHIGQCRAHWTVLSTLNSAEQYEQRRALWTVQCTLNNAEHIEQCGAHWTAHSTLDSAEHIELKSIQGNTSFAGCYCFRLTKHSNYSVYGFLYSGSCMTYSYTIFWTTNHSEVAEFFTIIFIVCSVIWTKSNDHCGIFV